MAETSYDLNLKLVTCLCHNAHDIFWIWRFTPQYFLVIMQWQFVTMQLSCHIFSSTLPH